MYSQPDGYQNYSASFTEDEYSGDGYEAVQLAYLESKVRFSLKHCDTDKKHCIKNVSRDKSLLGSLYKRLGHFEDMTWQIASETAREGGISIEKRDTDNFKDLSKAYGEFKTFGHLRVPASSKPKFRVFGAIQGDLFYILRFDVDGKQNH